MQDHIQGRLDRGLHARSVSFGLSKPEDAVREGAVSYIHFDAKYRITDLRSFIGTDEMK